MKTMVIPKIILIICLLFIFITCATRNATIRKDIQDLKPGISKQEIISRWGKPDNINVKYSNNVKYECYGYVIGEKEVETAYSYKPPSYSGGFREAFLAGLRSTTTTTFYSKEILLIYFENDKLMGWETTSP
jgi:hypothetical protein